MSQFLELCLQPPTLIFSVLMVPVLLYWILAVFGLVSHGLLHVADAADAVGAKLEGAVAGKAEALGHATDALAAKIEGLAAKADALDGLAAKIAGLGGKADALDGLGAKLEGLAGAKAEVLGQAVDGISSKVESFAGAAQAKIDGFGNAVEAVSGKADGILVVGRPALAGAAPGGFFGGFGFGEVPRSISWSLAIFFGWLTSLLAVALYPEVAVWSGRALWAGAFVSFGALLVAIGLSAVAVQPLRLLMDAGWGQTRNDLVGKVCIIRTQRVDAGFGQAEVLRDGSVVQVRDLEGRGLLRGHQAVIFDYDDEREVFLVAPFDPATGRPLPMPAMAPMPPAEPPAATPSSPSPSSSRAPQASAN